VRTVRPDYPLTPAPVEAALPEHVSQVPAVHPAKTVAVRVEEKR